MHFSLAVIFQKEDILDLKEVLMRYHEFDSYQEEYKDYIEFKDMTEDYREEYLECKEKFVLLPNGIMLEYTDLLFYDEQFQHEVPEGSQIIEKDVSENWTYEEYLEEWCGFEKCELTGKYGYWGNTMAKWDWYEIGGRYANTLRLKGGVKADIIKIDNIDFSLDTEVYLRSIRFWELYIEEQEPLTDDDKKMIESVYLTKDYFKTTYNDKIEYAVKQSSFNTYAVITSDGEWHQACEDSDYHVKKKAKVLQDNWENDYYDNFIKPNLNNYIIIIDCHI